MSTIVVAVVAGAVLSQAIRFALPGVFKLWRVHRLSSVVVLVWLAVVVMIIVAAVAAMQDVRSLR